MMKLDHLLRTIYPSRIDGPVDVEVTSIECDSRLVRHGSMFVAIRGGEEEDRQRFVGDAIRQGAGSVVVEAGTSKVDGDSAITRITVQSCRTSLAELAARFNEYPARDLLTVGALAHKKPKVNQRQNDDGSHCPRNSRSRGAELRLPRHTGKACFG